jgi:hypothetical protein
MVTVRRRLVDVEGVVGEQPAVPIRLLVSCTARYQDLPLAQRDCIKAWIQD